MVSRRDNFILHFHFGLHDPDPSLLNLSPISIHTHGTANVNARSWSSISLDRVEPRTVIGALSCCGVV